MAHCGHPRNPQTPTSYWQFDPKGEWIPEQLRGDRLAGDRYEPITDGRSAPLQLRVVVDGPLIALYREDTGAKLLAPDELVMALQTAGRLREQAEQRAEQERQRAEQERQRAEQERQRAEQAEAEVERLKQQLRSLGIDPRS